MMPVATHLSGPWRCILERTQGGLRATFSRDATAGYHYQIEAAPADAGEAWLAATLALVRVPVERADARQAEARARRVSAAAAGACE